MRRLCEAHTKTVLLECSCFFFLPSKVEVLSLSQGDSWTLYSAWILLLSRGTKTISIDASFIRADSIGNVGLGVFGLDVTPQVNPEVLI